MEDDVVRSGPNLVISPDDASSARRGDHVIVAYAALVALLRGSCGSVCVLGEVIVAEDGVAEVRGIAGAPGEIIIADGLVPGCDGKCMIHGGLVSAESDGGMVTILASRGGKGVPVLRVLGGRAADLPQKGAAA